MGFLPNPYVILGLVAFYLVSMGGGMLWAHRDGAARNEAQHVAQDLADTKKVLGDFVTATGEMNKLATDFNGVNRDLSANIDRISRDFRNASRATPLPLDCKPDPFRVQSLTAAIAAANTAAGRGAVPAVPPTH